MSSTQDESTSLNDNHSKPPKPTGPPGKVALKPVQGPTRDALDRIASAAERERLGVRFKADEPFDLDPNQIPESKMENGKYVEIPSLLDGFRMVHFHNF
jgi:hypothetical protein